MFLIYFSQNGHFWNGVYTAHLDLKRVKHDWNKNGQGLRPRVNCVEELSDDAKAGSGASQREPEVVVWGEVDHLMMMMMRRRRRRKMMMRKSAVTDLP